MYIVEKYGRKNGYNFNFDEKLASIESGKYSQLQNTGKTGSILSIDGFMTIWLLTLPEKFNEWHEYHNGLIDNGDVGTTKILYSDGPKFPQFLSKNLSTCLVK